MDEVERRYILRVLEAMRGNKAEAARVLGFDRKTLYRKLERYKIAASVQAQHGGGVTSIPVTATTAVVPSAPVTAAAAATPDAAVAPLSPARVN